MRIAIENVDGAVHPLDLKKVIGALNKERVGGASYQIGFSSTVDAVIYVWKDEDMEAVLAHHDATASGLPFDVVLTSLEASWPKALERKAKELAAPAPAPKKAARKEPPPEEKPAAKKAKPRKR